MQLLAQLILGEMKDFGSGKKSARIFRRTLFYIYVTEMLGVFIPPYYRH